MSTSSITVTSIKCIQNTSTGWHQSRHVPFLPWKLLEMISSWLVRWVRHCPHVYTWGPSKYTIASFSNCAFFDSAMIAWSERLLADPIERVERWSFEDCALPLTVEVLERKLLFPELLASDINGSGGGEVVIRLVLRGDDDAEEVRNGERGWAAMFGLWSQIKSSGEWRTVVQIVWCRMRTDSAAETKYASYSIDLFFTKKLLPAFISPFPASSPRQICVLPLFCRIIFSRLKWELLQSAMHCIIWLSIQ